MNRKIQLAIFFIMVSFYVSAQKITFSYDNAGNRIERKVILKNATNAFIASTDKMTGGGIDLEEILSENVGNKKITIYPNPTRGKLILEVMGVSYDSNIKANLLDMKGTLLTEVKVLPNSRTTIYMQNLSAGNYLLLLCINNERLTYKIRP